MCAIGGAEPCAECGRLCLSHHQLGEGTFDEFAPPLIESRSKNYLTMALEEIAQGKLHWELPERT